MAGGGATGWTATGLPLFGVPLAGALLAGGRCGGACCAPRLGRATRSAPTTGAARDSRRMNEYRRVSGALPASPCRRSPERQQGTDGGTAWFLPTERTKSYTGVNMGG